MTHRAQSQAHAAHATALFADVRGIEPSLPRETRIALGIGYALLAISEQLTALQDQLTTDAPSGAHRRRPRGQGSA